MKLGHLFICLTLSLLLGACGGGGSGSSNSSSGDSDAGESGSSSGKSGFSLQVTDAPIDDIVAVVLQFTEVGLRKTDGTWINFPLDTPKSIDLLELQGKRTSSLLSDEPLPLGRYDEIRLLLDSSPMANYVDLGAAGLVELKVPGGASSGLKIKGNFVRIAGEEMTLVIDFDLRQSIKMAGKSGKYMMRPVLRLVNSEKAGHLRGKVSALKLSSKPACSDNNPDTYNAIYVFAGHDVIPEDIDQSSDLDIDPVATTAIRWIALKAAFEYEAAFLPEGDYTIAMTCNANHDDLDRGGDDLKFFLVRNVTVTVM